MRCQNSHKISSGIAESNYSEIIQLPKLNSPELGKSVSFFGLGNMGKWMSLNLCRAGYVVYGFDPSEKALEFANQAVS